VDEGDRLTTFETAPVSAVFVPALCRMKARNMRKSVHAEDFPYWKTSKSSAETWRNNAAVEIKRAGGDIVSAGDIMLEGRSTVFITFKIDGEEYRVQYPVLQSRTKNEVAAKIQAATAMYHDIKARCNSLRWTGARIAFGGYRLLPSGLTDGQLSTPELASQLLPLPAHRSTDDIVDSGR
jgi:hypothetical protein